MSNLEQRPDAAPEEEEADRDGEDTEQRGGVGRDGLSHRSAESADGSREVKARSLLSTCQAVGSESASGGHAGGDFVEAGFLLVAELVLKGEHVIEGFFHDDFTPA